MAGADLVATKTAIAMRATTTLFNSQKRLAVLRQAQGYLERHKSNQGGAKGPCPPPKNFQRI